MTLSVTPDPSTSSTSTTPLTEEQARLSRRFLVYRVLTNLWFWEGIWIYYYRLFITDQQIGLVDAAAFSVGLLAEIPSGAIADVIGRHRLVRLGHVLVACGILIQGLALEGWMLLFGLTLMMIGMAFASGSDEALFFQRLNFPSDSIHWKRLVAKSTQYGLLATVIAVAVGAWLYTFNPRLPALLTGVAFAIAAGSIWTLRDTRPRKPASIRDVRHTIRAARTEVVTGFRQFAQPPLRTFALVILVLNGLYYAFGWGVLKLFLVARFTFTESQSGLLLAGLTLLTAFSLQYYLRHAERMHERPVLIVLVLSASAALVASVFPIGYYGVLVLAALKIGEAVMVPVVSHGVNYRVAESQRSTALSVASTLRSLPYVALAPLIGYLNGNDQLQYFLIGWTVLLLGILTAVTRTQDA